MAVWLAAYYTNINCEPGNSGSEGACFRVHPEGETERWIAETNSALPTAVQEEIALMIAEALTKVYPI